MLDGAFIWITSPNCNETICPFSSFSSSKSSFSSFSIAASSSKSSSFDSFNSFSSSISLSIFFSNIDCSFEFCGFFNDSGDDIILYL